MIHANLFDRYQQENSPVHRLDPRVKVVIAFIFILSTVLLPDGAWIAYLLSFFLVVGLSFVSRLGAGFSFRRSFIALPFVLAAVTVIFTIPGETVFSLNIFDWHLVITDNGLIRFASIVLRSWISVQMAILLVATTSFPDLMHALRHLRFPSMLVSVISFMYRYLHVLADETLRLLRAREARSAQLPPVNNGQVPKMKPGGSFTWRARVAGSMVGQLMIRSFERSERVYNAMVARGYSGTLLTINPHILTTDDWLLGTLMVLSIAVIQLIARVF